MNSPLKIGSRGSKLAVSQVEEVVRLLGSGFSHELLTFKTKGDEDRTTPLTAQPADDFFTDTIDQALLEGRVDITVHSAKDLPQCLRPGLEILALTAPTDDTDAWVSPYHWKDLKPGAKVGTSSLLRQQQAKQLRPDLEIVDIRGTIEERIDLVDQKAVDGVIVASCALKRLGLSNLVRDVFPWEGMPLQGQLAVVGRSKDVELKELFKPIDARAKYGTVTLVGAGPGDPELITLKGIKALEKADCVFYDYLIDKNLLKYAAKAEHIYAGKRKGDHTLSQKDLCRMLKEKATQGANVVRLKGGDPLIFGRGAEEIQYLSAYHVPVHVIPGVSSATGIPSGLGIPLTARGISSSVAFVSAHEEDEDKTGPRPVPVPPTDTIVFLMGLTKLREIVASLKAKGWPAQTPVLISAKGTRVDEQVIKGNLSDIEDLAAKAQVKPPALIIAGKVVDLYKERPRKTFLHCGTNPELYHGLGRVIPWPMIAIESVTLDAGQLKKLNEDLDRADMVILTSPNAAEHFMKITRPRQDKVFAVIGRHTRQALEEFGITAQITSHEETAQGLFKTLSALMPLKGKRIVLPRSSLPNPFLKDALEKQGAHVMEWTAYSNVKPPKRELPREKIDGVIFTSPSTVKNFLEDYKAIPPEWEVLAKGPVTKMALEKSGYHSKIIT